MHKLAKAGIMREVKDYAYITLGLISYSLGWAAFLLPYQITTGGTTGISAIIYYSTGFPIQWSYFIINAVLMTFAIRILGPRFSIKTTYAIFMLTFLLWLFQLLVNNYVEVPDMTADGKPLLLGPGQDFMACIIGAAMCGVGLGIVFNYNGRTVRPFRFPGRAYRSTDRRSADRKSTRLNSSHSRASRMPSSA